MQSVGSVKKVELSYGPGGVSRGIATVIFPHADSASKAFADLNGLLIDNRPVKVSAHPDSSLTREANCVLQVEVVVSSAEQIPQPKALSQRISQPKAHPKSAATDKSATSAAKGAAGAKLQKKPRRGRSARPAKKTAEELDSEMADYFDGTSNQNAETNGAAPAATNGDAPMDDEIM